MDLKLIMALVNEEKTEPVMQAARESGATGATIITSVRGEGLTPEKSFLGLDLTSQRNVLMFLVAEPKARSILETISRAGQFDEEPGTGIAFQISIEDAIGLKTQTPKILSEIEEEV